MASARRTRILHLHSTFKLGGKEARDVDLINHFGDRFEHVIVSAEAGAFAAADLIDRRVPFTTAACPPYLAGPMRPGRLRDLGRYIRGGGFDLVLSFNFGAMDGVLANLLWGGRPLVHHEDGFNEDEAGGQKRERVLYRRLALRGARHLVVPSTTLEKIARESWMLRAPQLQRIPNGIDLDSFRDGPDASAIAGLERTDATVIVGTVAGLRKVKNLPRLVRAFAAAIGRAGQACDARLVIVGSGPEEAAIRATAEDCGIADRLLMPGFLPHPHRYMALFDIFALSSDSEQFPISLVEAMAAGRPAVAPLVGDIGAIIADENRSLMTPPGDEAALTDSLARLLGDPALRQRLGAANRARANAEFGRGAMFARYAEVYASAMGCRRTAR